MKSLDDNGVFEAILARVTEEAKRRGVSGVFAMADLLRPGYIRYALVNRSSALRVGEAPRRDANLMCVCLTKLAMVVTHLMNTGQHDVLFGEVEFRGGRLAKEGMFAYAFSGAPEEVDDELTVVAEEAHIALS